MINLIFSKKHFKTNLFFNYCHERHYLELLPFIPLHKIRMVI